MGLRYRAFDQITAEDLRVLIRNKVFEKTNLEYKRDLPGKTDRYKKEYLKDVSSFANASGGHLIFGIEEKNGIPVDFAPLHESIIDSEIVRLHEMIDTGIRPRIHSLEIREVKLSADEYLIIVRIPRSYNKPHMVTFNKSSRFYSRSSKGAFQMDIDQIRAATLSSRDIVDRIRLFRKSRVEAISNGDRPISTTSGPYVVFHLIPYSSFDVGIGINLAVVANNEKFLTSLGWTPQQFRYNLDGYLGYHYWPEGDSHLADAYIQVFRSGAIETVRTLYSWTKDYSETIPAIQIERWILETLDSLSHLVERTDIDWPVLAMLTLLGVKDYRISELPYYSTIHPFSIDRTDLLIPEVIIENGGIDLESVLRPAFDALWNSAGLPKSITYNDEGVRKTERFPWVRPNPS